MFDDWQEVTLSTGVVLRVRPMPAVRLQWKIAARYPNPEPPIREIPSQIPGGTPTRIVIENDADYQAELRLVEEQRRNAVTDFNWTWAIELPDPSPGWKVESGLSKVLTRGEWRKGKDGERLDYLEYIVLRFIADHNTVFEIINSAKAATEEEVKAAEDSFRGDDPG